MLWRCFCGCGALQLQAAAVPQRVFMSDKELARNHTHSALTCALLDVSGRSFSRTPPELHAPL